MKKNCTSFTSNWFIKIVTYRNYEIIFVLDPSKDNTEQLILENLNNNPKIKLIKLSRRFGQPAAILAGKKDLEEKFKSVGIKIGLLFQIKDDFLDKYGSADILGKPAQQDVAKGKNTLIDYLGEGETKKLMNNLQVEIEKDLKPLSKTNALLDCMSFIINRKN